MAVHPIAQSGRIRDHQSEVIGLRLDRKDFGVGVFQTEEDCRKADIRAQMDDRLEGAGRFGLSYSSLTKI